MNNSMNNRIVSSLAILKVNFDSNKDYISNFVPFVAEALRALPSDAISVIALKNEIASHFGLNIPQSVLKILLRRCHRQNYIRIDNGISFRVMSNLPDLSLNKLRVTFSTQYEQLLTGLVGHAGKKNLDWDLQIAEVAFTEYLDENSVPILNFAIEGTPLISELPHGSAQFRYIVHSYVLDCFHNDPVRFTFLETVAKGNMLSNMLIFPYFGSVPAQFETVKIYCDTQFTLRALGLAGKAHQEAAGEILRLLYEQNAKLRIFEETYQEILGILEACQNLLLGLPRSRPPFGETLEYFTRSGTTASDVRLIIGRLPELLQTLLHVRVTPAPEHTKPLGLNEVRMKEILREDVRYSTVEALNHDIDALTAIHRIRNGKTMRFIESCQAIFVTTNLHLARASARFFSEEYERATVPLCLLDYIIGTIAWLKSPTEVPEFPKKFLISDCYAALNPPDSLWRKYLGEVERVRADDAMSESDYYVLRYSPEARLSLMDVTYGSPEAFVEGSLNEVLEKAKDQIKSEIELKLGQERDRRENVESVMDRQRMKMKLVAARCGKYGSNGIGMVFYLAVLVGFALSAPWEVVGVENPFGTALASWLRLLLSGLLLVFMVLSVLNLLWGVTIRRIRRVVAVRISKCIEKRLLGWTGL